MAADMKETIALAARTLLFEKRVKKLTVKDIVEECQMCIRDRDNVKRINSPFSEMSFL